VTEEEDRDHHADSVVDTGEAYTQFHGWVLSCLWCEYKAYGRTKREALKKLYENHYEKYGITVH